MVKTTYRFGKNNVSFWWKQRVVLWEVTCCFQTTFGCRKNYRWATHQKQSFSNCKKIYNHPLSRARVRAHHRTFCIFAVTSVTAPIIIHYIPNYYANHRHILTNKQFNPHKQGRKYLEKLPFLIYIFHHFEVLFSPICDTCDSKKSTSLLEGARIHPYEKENTITPQFCHLHNTKQRARKISCRFFLDFSLFEDFSTPISIGTHSRCTFTMRIPNYQLHFHGESLSTYIPYSGASSYIPSRQPPVTVYYSSSILQVSR